MRIGDAIFGDIEIHEPVLIDLISSPPLQRLKNIDQAGYPAPFFPNLLPHNRFEHSVGVCLLLRRYNASVEEQIAGLIHDVSHTAFSHCADYIFGSLEGGKTQSHQDDMMEPFVRKSVLPEVLADHGFNLQKILDDRHFPLKEQPLPDLCADRIDYSLRSALAGGFRTAQQLREVLSTLLSDGRHWFFASPQDAHEYASLFLSLNTSLWSGIGSATMFRALQEFFSYATKKGYLHLEDFYGTDETVLHKVKQYLLEDSTLAYLYDRMHNKHPVSYTPNDSSKIFCKSRAVDPLCVYEGALWRLSDVDSSWKEIISKESEPKMYHITFLGEAVLSLS